MSCSGRQSVNPNGCCKSGIVGTRCNPNKYWSSPVARGGEGAVVTHVASITLVKVACCVRPCRRDIRWVVPAAHCLESCLVSWRSFASGGLIFLLSPLNQGLLILVCLASICPIILVWKFLIILETLVTLVRCFYLRLEPNTSEQWPPRSRTRHPCFKRRVYPKVVVRLGFMPVQSCMTESSAERRNLAERRYFEECLILSFFFSLQWISVVFIFVLDKILYGQKWLTFFRIS